MKWKLVLSAWDRRILDKVAKEICGKAEQNLVKCSVIPLPNDKKLFTVLSSPHIYKTTRDQYFWESKKLLVYLGDCQLSIFENLSIPHSVNLTIKAVNKNVNFSKMQPNKSVKASSGTNRRIVDLSI